MLHRAQDMTDYVIGAMREEIDERYIDAIEAACLKLEFKCAVMTKSTYENRREVIESTRKQVVDQIRYLEYLGYDAKFSETVFGIQWEKWVDDEMHPQQDVCGVDISWYPKACTCASTAAEIRRLKGELSRSGSGSRSGRSSSGGSSVRRDGGISIGAIAAGAYMTGMLD